MLWSLALPFQSQANHIFGTELSYRCLGNHQYEITLITYLDCGGTAPPATFNLTVSSFSCDTSLAVIPLNLIPSRSGDLVTGLCSSFAANSSCNGGTLPGESKAVYMDTITLPAACPDWILSFNDFIRSSYYTNLVNPAGSLIYVDASLDNTFGRCDDAPFVKNPTMLYPCAGQPFWYNIGSIDLQLDSLTYTLINPQTGPNGQSASFQPGLSTTTPMALAAGTSFDLDRQRGILQFTPASGTSQFACIAIRVDQWRGGINLGHQIVEYDIVVNAFCANAAIVPTTPTVTNGNWVFDDLQQAFVGVVDSTSSTLTYGFELQDLSGDTISPAPSSTWDSMWGSGNWSIFLNTLSPYQHDSVQLFINLNISEQGAAANFPLDTTVVHYNFIDRICPYQSKTTLHHRFLKPFVLGASSMPVVCTNTGGTVNLMVAASDTMSNIIWTQLNNNNSIINPSNPSSAQTSINIPPNTPPQELTYLVRATMLGELVFDEVKIQVVTPPDIGLQVTNSSTANSNDGSASTMVTGNLKVWDYAWDDNNSSSARSNLSPGTYVLTVTDFYGCASTDTAVVGIGTSVQNNKAPLWDILVFPNPTNTRTIQINYQSQANDDFQIAIFNSLGQCVSRQSLPTLGHQGQLSLTIPDLPTGTYALSIQQGQQQHIQALTLYD